MLYTNKTIISKILRLARPFTGLFIISIILNILFSILQTIAIVLINPLLQLLFSNNSSSQTDVSSNVTNNISNSYPIISDLKELFAQLKESFFELIIIPNDLTTSLMRLGIFIIIIFVIKNIIKYAAAIVGVMLQEGLIKTIRDLTFTKLTALSINFFKRNSEGKIISIITNDAQALNQNTIMKLTVITRDSIQVILFFLLLISISPKLLLISVGSGLISLVIFRFSFKYLKRYASKMQTAMADYTSTMQETISGFRIIKAYNSEKFINKKFHIDTHRYLKTAIKNRKMTALIPAISEVVAIFALSLVLLVGGSDVANNNISAADFMTFLFALFAMMAPMNQVMANVARFQHGFVAATRVFSILDEQSEVTNGTKKIHKFKESIKVENVSFGYSENTGAIDNINLIIPHNKKIAFVGASGSGKSTMLDLIIRFYDPKQGQIIIDNEVISDLDVVQYRNLFGIVSQENILFNDTIFNNIRYGLDSLSNDDIINYAKNANAYDFIMKMPEGFDTVIGNRGTNMSGGERQRIAIARALARNPEILIFDEATSALDAESEKIVQKAIDSSLKKKTAIIVAHRLSTIINCDIIYVFDQGKIIEFGSHSELLEINGIYKKLIDLQFSKLNI